MDTRTTLTSIARLTAATLSLLPLALGTVISISALSASAPAYAQEAAAQPVQNAMMIVIKGVNLSGNIQEAMVKSSVNITALRNDISDLIQRDLTNSGQTVVRRDVMMTALNEARLTYEGIVDPTTAAAAGKAVGARYVVLITVDGNYKTKLLSAEYNTMIHYDIVDVQAQVNMQIPGADGKAEGKQGTNPLEERIEGMFKSSDAWRDSKFGKSVMKASTELCNDLKSCRPTSWAILDVEADELVIEGGAQAGHKEGMAVEICHIRVRAGLAIEKVIALGEITLVQGNRSLVKVTSLTDKNAPVEKGYIVRGRKTLMQATNLKK